MQGIYVDIVIATILTLFAIRGLDQGFVGANKLLIATFASIYIASEHPHIPYGIISKYFSTSLPLEFISFFVTFVFFLLVAYTIAILFKLFVVGGGAFSLYDKLLGLLFAIFKVGIVLSLLFYSFSTVVAFNEETNKALGDSIGYVFLNNIGSNILGEYLNGSADPLQKLANGFVDFQMSSAPVVQQGINNGASALLNGALTLDEETTNRLKENLPNLQNNPNLIDQASEVFKGFLAQPQK